MARRRGRSSRASRRSYPRFLRSRRRSSSRGPFGISMAFPKTFRGILKAAAVGLGATAVVGIASAYVPQIRPYQQIANGAAGLYLGGPVGGIAGFFASQIMGMAAGTTTTGNGTYANDL